ncbi:hypothetical protein [Paenibacillus chitinolyticus]|uniref:hypothetical protein n=1 Tax=Paenibacillus chitinolyticus TaxID=79263 RepID=UPI001C44D594|nr:hypothetical protein [Paenibacillus chitinolyticus]MBV6717245.1 hypothetical protein [Paenibacillus chitinolyticus]
MEENTNQFIRIVIGKSEESEDGSIEFLESVVFESMNIALEIFRNLKKIGADDANSTKYIFDLEADDTIVETIETDFTEYRRVMNQFFGKAPTIRVTYRTGRIAQLTIRPGDQVQFILENYTGENEVIPPKIIKGEITSYHDSNLGIFYKNLETKNEEFISFFDIDDVISISS